MIWNDRNKRVFYVTINGQTVVDVGYTVAREEDAKKVAYEARSIIKKALSIVGINVL